MEVTGDEQNECQVSDNRVEKAIGKTGSHTRDYEQDDLFNVHVALENNGEDHPLVIESESQNTSINNVETAQSDNNWSTEATGDITIETTRSSTENSLENIRTLKNIDMKTVNMIAGLDPFDQDSEIHDGPTGNKQTIEPTRDDENVTTNRIENNVTADKTTLYVWTKLKEDVNDDIRNEVQNKEAIDGFDDIDGLGKLVKTLFTCASRKGMTMDEDNRPFVKANEENVDEHGAGSWVQSPLNDQDIEIKTYTCTPVVREKLGLVSQCTFSLGEPCTEASTVYTAGCTEVPKEKSRLPSKGEEKVTTFSQKNQINSKIGTGRDILLVDPYNFNRSHRGYMVIIVNQTFKHQAFRDGAHKDIEYLNNIAYKLGLTVYAGLNTNMSLTETLQLLEDVRSLDHSDCAMLAVAFSTHGLEQPNPKAKGNSDHALVCADDRLIFTSTITEMFNDDHCPSLKDKPKLFIIQACRGEEHDKGADLCVAKKNGIDRTCGGYADTRWQPPLDDSDVRFAKDSWAGGPDNQGQPAHLHDDHKTSTGNYSSALPVVPQFTSAQLVREPRRSSPQPKPFPYVDTPSLKCENDQLVFYAIPPGMFAWRNTEDGSWMLYYLNIVIEMCDSRRPINMLKLLLKVNAKMALRTTNVPTDENLDRKKAISVVEHKLTRDLIFPPLVK